MVSPQVLLIVAILGGGYYVGDYAVKGIKKVDHAVVHVAKATGKKVGHGFVHAVTFGKK
jgi:hypothetical protein